MPKRIYLYPYFWEHTKVEIRVEALSKIGLSPCLSEKSWDLIPERKRAKLIDEIRNCEIDRLWAKAKSQMKGG